MKHNENQKDGQKSKYKWTVNDLWSLDFFFSVEAKEAIHMQKMGSIQKERKERILLYNHKDPYVY